MTDNQQVESPADRYIAYLGRFRDNRGAMADLRHGFSEATSYRAWPHIAAWCDLTSDRERVIAITVAAGFATHGGTDAKAGNMGRTLRRVAQGESGSDKGLASFDGRFRRLLSCNDPIEMCPMLVGILRAAERRGVGVDYSQLYRDLTYWTHDTKAKVRWAASFWGTDKTLSEGDGE